MQGARDASPKTGATPLFPLVGAPPTARPLAIDGIPDWLKTSQLLTEPGRRNVAKVASLVLSGIVPVIEGPEADEVLDILASMLAGGAATILDCDPTVIPFDDLWRRPGDGALTALGHALDDARSSPKVRLCAIRRAELSPSGFWIDGLRRAGRHRSIPKELLLCVTRSAESDEEAPKQALVFRAEGWIDRSAGSHALAWIADEEFERVVDVSELPFDPAAALQVTATSKMRLSISEARWLAAFVPIAKAVLKEDAGAFVREILETAAMDHKPALKLIDNGGASRA